jgi:flagellar biosynthesis chaperone FliJ
MEAVNKHYGDVNTWIEKIIDSCDSPKQEQTIQNLINQFEKMLDNDSKLDSYFRRTLIRNLEIMINNKIDELFYKKIKEQEKEENYG